MIRLWDGILSAICAAITLAMVAVPLWGAVAAVQAGLTPTWSWVGIIGLGFVGGGLVLAFLRKAWRGVHPLRERRRS
ncbi:MAG: hypothetical protein AAGF55_03350 [Pseudomonadota bacterium]